MNIKKNKLLIVGALVIVLIGAVLAYKTFFVSRPQPTIIDENPSEEVVPADASIGVDLTRSRSKENTIVISISNLGNKYASLEYELSFETQGLIQGVSNGLKPIDISGKDTFVRDDIYLGTCSGKVCKPYIGIKKISVVLQFTDLEGKKSQFSKDYEI